MTLKNNKLHYFLIKMDSGISKINEYMKLACFYKDKEDLGNAFKYAALASVVADIPRADVCLMMGDLYLKIENYPWAELWYKQAIGNVYLTEETNVDESMTSWLPLLRLAFLYYKLKDYETANEYNNSVLLLKPDNEDAIYNKKKFDEILNKED